MMFKCPECGRMFEKERRNQVYCHYEMRPDNRSRCSHRAADRRQYRTIDPEVCKRKRERTKRWQWQARTEGRCIGCGNAPAEPGLIHCAECGGRDR